MVIYILTKFGADWFIFVDARVLTRKLWTDVGRTDGHGRTKSDHNSSLSTLCSGELTICPRSFNAGAKSFSNIVFYPVILYQIITIFDGPEKESCKKKEENAPYQHFIFFSMFSTLSHPRSIIPAPFKLLFANISKLAQSKILLFG